MPLFTDEEESARKELSKVNKLSIFDDLVTDD